MKSTRTQPADYPPVEQARGIPPLQLVASLNASSLNFLRQQLEVDRETNDPIGFKPDELQLMQQLLTRHPDGQTVEAHDNIVLTYPESNLLTIYANRCFQLAVTRGDIFQRNVYGDALYNLMHGATLITQTDQLPLDLTYYGFHSLTRPLAVLWIRFCALVRGHSARQEYHPFEPFTV